MESLSWDLRCNHFWIRLHYPWKNKFATWGCFYNQDKQVAHSLKECSGEWKNSTPWLLWNHEKTCKMQVCVCVHARAHTGLSVVWTSPRVASGPLQDVPMWMGLWQAIWSHPRARPAAPSDQNLGVPFTTFS